MSTARPPTLRVLHGVELFACTRIPAELSRRACAARFVAVVGAGRSAISQTIDQGPCRDCPIGALHEREVRSAGSTTRMMQGLRSRTKRRVLPPTSPAPEITAPPAVVPPKAGKPPRTPALAAGAQPVAPPDDGTDASARERTSPAETEPPPTPSGEQVSAGRRTGGYRKGDPRASVNGRTGGRTPMRLAHPETGETLTIDGWAARLGVSRHTIADRLDRGLPLARVLVGYTRPEVAAGMRRAAEQRGEGHTVEGAARLRVLAKRIADAQAHLARLEWQREQIEAAARERREEARYAAE